MLFFFSGFFLLLFGQLDFDMKFTELLDGGFCRSIHHQVLCLLVEGEGNDFTDVGLIGEHHHGTVNTGGDTAVRGRTEFESVDHAAELFIDGACRMSGDFKRLVHDFRTMVTDGSGRKFDAVADDIVLISENIQRIFGEQSIFIQEKT